jgi:phosphoribosylformylglycinamidine synthase
LEVGEPPQLDWRLEKAVQMVCREGIRDGFIKSAHDCSEGGLAVCLAECCIAGDIGAKVVVPAETVAAAARPSAVLFGETASRIVVTVAPDRLDELMAVAQRHQCPAFVLGEVGGDELSVTVERVYFSVSVGDLRRVWASLPSYLE